MGNTTYKYMIEDVKKSYTMSKKIKNADIINCNGIINGYYLQNVYIYDSCIALQVPYLKNVHVERSVITIKNCVNLHFNEATVCVLDTNSVVYNPDYPCDISKFRNVRVYNVSIDTDFSFLKKCKYDANIKVFSKMPLLIDVDLIPRGATINIIYQ